MARYGAVAVPHALSHRDTPAILAISARVSIAGFGEFSKGRGVAPPVEVTRFFFAFAAMICYSGRAGRWYGRCRRYGDMGEGEILRLWANVWLSPAVLPEEGRVQALQNSAKAGGLPGVGR